MDSNIDLGMREYWFDKDPDHSDFANSVRGAWNLLAVGFLNIILF